MKRGPPSRSGFPGGEPVKPPESLSFPAAPQKPPPDFHGNRGAVCSYRMVMKSFRRGPLAARISRSGKNSSGAPWRLVTTPPASWTISMPAA